MDTSEAPLRHGHRQAGALEAVSATAGISAAAIASMLPCLRVAPMWLPG